MKFNDAQIATLRAEWSKIRSVDPGTPAYKRLITFLDKLPPALLEQIANEQIPFVSGLAKNRV